MIYKFGNPISLSFPQRDLESPQFCLQRGPEKFIFVLTQNMKIRIRISKNRTDPDELVKSNLQIFAEFFYWFE